MADQVTINDLYDALLDYEAIEQWHWNRLNSTPYSDPNRNRLHDRWAKWFHDLTEVRGKWLAAIGVA